jgi:hypothetical protein
MTLCVIELTLSEGVTEWWLPAAGRGKPEEPIGRGQLRQCGV